MATKEVHPYFLALGSIVQMIQDPNCRDLIQQMIRGKPPSGFTMNKQRLRYGKGKGSTCIALIGDPVADGQNIISFVMQRQARRPNVIQRSFIDEITGKNFKDLRVTDRIIVIDEFVDRQSEVLKLTFEQKSSLTRIIKHSLQTGQITSSDIMMDRGRIITIDGIAMGPDRMFSPMRPIEMNTKVKPIEYSQKSGPRIGFVEYWNVRVNNMGNITEQPRINIEQIEVSTSELTTA